MRAAGIPTVAEHTIWTRRNGEHYWCAFLNEDGRFLPFAPEYEGPDSLIYNLTKPFLTPAKVYRYGFAPLHPVTTESTDEYRTFLKNPIIDRCHGAIPTTCRRYPYDLRPPGEIKKSTYLPLYL